MLPQICGDRDRLESSIQFMIALALVIKVID